MSETYLPSQERIMLAHIDTYCKKALDKIADRIKRTQDTNDIDGIFDDMLINIKSYFEIPNVKTIYDLALNNTASTPQDNENAAEISSIVSGTLNSLVIEVATKIANENQVENFNFEKIKKIITDYFDQDHIKTVFLELINPPSLPPESD